MQAFKETDLKEAKVRDALIDPLELISNDRTTFYDEAYEAFPLGDVIYDLKRAPLVSAISRQVFRQSFFAIFEMFTRPGTFEFYLDVFRAIFGADVQVTFTVPAPGKLLINVEALSIVMPNFAARRIVNNAYVFDEVITHDGDNIVFQVTQGIQSQAELDALIFDLYPAGVWVETSLSIT